MTNSRLVARGDSPVGLNSALGGSSTGRSVRWPAKVPAGRVDTETVISALDIFPTVAAMTKLVVPFSGGYRLRADA